MWLAVNDVFCPKWTEQIHEEWIRSVLKDRVDLTRADLERPRRLMDQNAGDCLVTEYEHHIQALDLPDPNDRHVLAAALEVKADAIATWNVSDFPSELISTYGIDVLTPDQLVGTLFQNNKEGVLTAMRDHRRSLKNPPKTPAQYLETLRSQGLHVSANLFSENTEILE